MRTRTLAILTILMVALFAAPQFSARQGGINAQGDAGCSCHGSSATDATLISVTGLPETFNASESYPFTLSITNDALAYDGTTGAKAGFRILVSGGGSVVGVPDSITQDMDGGLTHTTDSNKEDSWEFIYNAPSDTTGTTSITILGNAVNGNGAADTGDGDQWNRIEISIPGVDASGTGFEAPPLTILMTVMGLAVALIVLAAMWVFYRRSPDTFTMNNFWNYVKPWLTTTDHKYIGILYFLYGLFFFLVGGILALLFRIQLALPENDFLSYDEYNSFFTLHGTTMIFLAAMPMIAGFANYVLPLQIGAQDLAFPRINALGFWLLVAAAPLIYTGIWTGDSADITWVMYPPYSSLTDSAYGANSGTTAFISGMLLLGASSTLAGINFIATVFTMRAHGVTWMKMPLFTWSLLISIFMLYLSLPALVISLVLLLLDHSIGSSFFTTGGDPLLFQHLFWFFGHPEVYVVIVPAFGIVSEVLATSARRSVFGYKSMVYAMVGIGVVGFIVWGHHMITSGMDPFWRAAFMITTMAVAIPTGIKVFNWLATLWGGALVMKTHTLWALGFVVTFTLGGISGMFFPVAGLDTHFHDSYFVVAHFHYVFIGGTIFGMFAGLYYWYPKVTGRKMDETLGLWHFLISFASYNAAFWPMHQVGIMGMPRRTHTYTVESGFAELNMAITIFAIIFGISQLILVWNLIASAKKGEKVGNDPWGGWSLEWATTSPPPTPSFAEIPTQKDANEGIHHEPSAMGNFFAGMANRLWAIGEKEQDEEVSH